MNPTLHTAVLAALENAVGRALDLDPAARQALAGLGGRVFQIEPRDTGADIFLLPGDTGIELRGVYDGPVDSHIIGTIPDFVELISAEDAASTLINGGISLHGDSAPLLELQAILHRLDLDWEGALAGKIGDIPAHQLGRVVRGGLRWGQQAFGSLNRQIEEFLHEEARVLPPEAELQGFYDAVGQLSQSVERLDARLQRQRQRLHKLLDAKRSGQDA